MKRFFALLVCLCLVVAPAAAVADRPANGYVGDYANVLSQSTEDHIVDRNKTLFAETGGEIVVVAVDFMDGMDAESYAKACFNDWGVGSKERNNGLLLVYAVGENKVWAMRGDGLADALTVSTLNGLLEDCFYDGYDAGDYDGATLAFFDAAYDWYDSYYAGSATPGGARPAEETESDSGVFVAIGVMGFLFLLVLAVVIFLLVFDAARYTRYRRRYYGVPGYIYRPLFFGRHWHHHRGGPPMPPGGPGFGPTPGGGHSRGGGAGRRGSSFSGFSSRHRSSGHSFRSGGSFHFGGHSRGGGAGRR